MPPYLKTQANQVNLYLYVQPRASRNELVGLLGNELKIKIAAPPVDSAANDALVRFISEVLDCPRAAVRIVRGSASRHKVLRITGLPVQRIQDRLSLP